MRISIREKILLTLLLCAGVIYLCVTYLIVPDLDQITLLETEQMTLEAELSRIQSIPARETQVDTSIEEQMNLLDTMSVAYFHTTLQEEIILLVNDLFEAEGIQVDNFNFSIPEMVTVGNTDFLNTRIDVSYLGDYETVLQVLDTLWAFPKNIQVAQINMSVAEMIYDEDTLALMEEGFDIPYDVVVTDVEADLEDQDLPDETASDETASDETTEEEATRVFAAPQVMVAGNMTLELKYLLLDTVMVDGLYTWYVDDVFQKENPFIPYSPTNATIRYIFTGEGASLFNFDRYSRFDDIEGHWMEDEIQAFLESGYIFNNSYNLFGPDQPLTRGEFVVLLDSVFQWEAVDQGANQTVMDVTRFSDYDSIGDLNTAYARAIQRALERRFLEGYSNNTLALDQFISYGEVTLIMSRITEDPDFNWETVAGDITRQKGITSTRWQDDSEVITKAEAVYLLTYFR